MFSYHQQVQYRHNKVHLIYEMAEQGRVTAKIIYDPLQKHVEDYREKSVQLTLALKIKFTVTIKQAHH